MTVCRALGEKTSRRKGSAVTIHEVARHASVSPMTVSRVINGESNVRDSTRETVMEAVRALNYRPNPAARVLAGARDTRIALIYSNPSASYLSEMLVGALDGSHRTASQLVLDRWDNLKPAAGKSRGAALSEGIAGVILPPPLCESKAIAAAFAAEGVPVVALATGRAREDVSCVRIDDFHAAREMTAAPRSRRATRASLSSRASRRRPRARQRLAGFEAAHGRKPGIEVDHALVMQGFFSYKSGLEAAEKLLARKRSADRDLRQQRRHGGGAAISVAHRRGARRAAAICRWSASTTRRSPPPYGPSSPRSGSPIAAMAEARHQSAAPQDPASEGSARSPGGRSPGAVRAR